MALFTYTPAFLRNERRVCGFCGGGDELPAPPAPPAPATLGAGRPELSSSASSSLTSFWRVAASSDGFLSWPVSAVIEVSSRSASSRRSRYSWLVRRQVLKSWHIVNVRCASSWIISLGSRSLSCPTP